MLGLIYIYFVTMPPRPLLRKAGVYITLANGFLFYLIENLENKTYIELIPFIVSLTIQLYCFRKWEEVSKYQQKQEKTKRIGNYPITNIRHFFYFISLIIVVSFKLFTEVPINLNL
jgi:protein-S-isoprenylcysteine O-methyltransferase Ste14